MLDFPGRWPPRLHARAVHPSLPARCWSALHLRPRDALPEAALRAVREASLDARCALRVTELPALERLSLPAEALSTPGLTAALEAHPALRELTVWSHGALTHALARAVASAPRLTHWFHEGDKQGEAQPLGALRDAAGLRGLWLVNAPALGARDLEPLRALRLASLTVDRTPLSPEALRGLSGHETLASLCVENVRGLPPRHWDVLAELPALEAFSAADSEVGPSLFERLARLERLRAVDVSHSNAEGGALAALRALTRLEVLGVRHAERSSKALATLFAALDLRCVDLGSVKLGPWLRGLQERGTIERLDLVFCELPDATVRALAQLPRLRELRLSHSKKWTPRGLAALARAPSLERLELEHVALEDSVLEALACSSTLRELVLTGATGLGDAGLRALAGSAALRELVVSFQDALTGEGLVQLAGIPTLERLDAVRCPLVEPAHAARARAVNPALELVLECWQEELEGVARSALVAPAVGWDNPYCAARQSVLCKVGERFEARSTEGEVRAEMPAQYLLHMDVFRATGTLVASGGKQELAVRDLRGRLLRRESFPSSLVHATASRDGALLLAVEARRLFAWRLGVESPLFVRELPWVASRVACSLAGDVVTVSGQGALCLRVVDGSELWRREDPVRWARSFDGATVDLVTQDGDVERCSLATGERLERWTPTPTESMPALSVGVGRVVRAREPRRRYSALEVHLAGRTPEGGLRVLTGNGELWDRAGSVSLDLLSAVVDSAELAEDGLTLTVKNRSKPEGLELYRVDALLAFARAPSP